MPESGEGGSDRSLPPRAEIEASIIAKALADPEYLAALRADPRRALGEELGIDLPAFVDVTVLEDSLTHVHLVLPAAPVDQLSDSDLELVAGGVGCWSNWQTDYSKGYPYDYLDIDRNGRPSFGE